jgi:hypothetical protein
LSQIELIFNVTRDLIFPLNTALGQDLTNVNNLFNSHPSLLLINIDTLPNDSALETNIAAFANDVHNALPSQYNAATISDIFIDFNNTSQDNIVSLKDLPLVFFLNCLSSPGINSFPNLDR